MIELREVLKLSWAQVTETLIKEGFTNSSGGKLTLAATQQFYAKMAGKKSPPVEIALPETFGSTNTTVRKIEEKPPAPAPVYVAPPKQTPKTLPKFVMDILTDPDMTDTKKVRMLMAYAEE